MRPLMAFDPADLGTPERDWRVLLSHSAKWSPPRGGLIVVAPHPDDEILGAGGLMHSWARNGAGVMVISVTDGEAADTTRTDLASVRRAELRDALGLLSSFPIPVASLGIPDGKVRHHESRLRAALDALIQESVTLIAPYELDGHPDHDAVGRICLEVARDRDLPLARYPVWTWHHTEPRELRDLRFGLFPLEPAARRAKARALQCFESQLRPLRGAPIVPTHVLARFDRPFEAFVL